MARKMSWTTYQPSHPAWRRPSSRCSRSSGRQCDNPLDSAFTLIENGHSSLFREQLYQPVVRVWLTLL
jgi:hypothetical protein